VVAFVWQPNRDELKRYIYVIDVPRMEEEVKNETKN